ncbi:DNA repair helicase [Coprinopsis marcescibilis]|uniref:ATP-dependent DNA helicase CHL1 n=1 Tax=Coprinopsis marcescibilis TaxID=230819 RepID=A0A5C3KJG5_COPMA|nr:DNA repair helicase [Coprinopsis marcescibilis]
MDLHLPTPSEFPAFPYDPPYPIQVDLMRHVYTSIEQRSVSIVESPTGTVSTQGGQLDDSNNVARVQGKTLTLLCSSLTWLLDEQNRARKGKLKAISGVDGDESTGAPTLTYQGSIKDWVIEQTLARARRELEAEEREYEDRLAKARKREEQMRRMAAGRKYNKEAKKLQALDKDEDEDEDLFLPEDEEHDEDGDYVSPELRALMQRLDRVQRSSHLSEEEQMTCTKIYYASRTHSQLSQVLPELRRLKLKESLSVTDFHDPPVPAAPGPDIATWSKKRPVSHLNVDTKVSSSVGNVAGEGCDAQFRTVSLGSRKQLCIHEELKAKVRDLDEACRELLGGKGDKRCPYLPPPGEEVAMVDFRDQILASPKDIEDLAEAGRLANTCPYFGSRKAISQAELVTLPYNLLLQKSAREALGIDLKDQIVIIDEAHNLIPTLLSLSTHRLPFATLLASLEQVAVYVKRFKTRLSPSNLLQLKRLVIFLEALKKYIHEWKTVKMSVKDSAEKVEVMKVSEMMQRMDRRASVIDLLEVEAYLKRSKASPELQIARKISGYSDKQAEKNGDPAVPRKSRKGTLPPLHAVEDFMLALSNSNDDGRVTFSLIVTPGQEPSVELKYQLLNPAPSFLEVVEDARSVILAGGTMSPISDIVNQLFYSVPSERITSFSCGHVIPEDNIKPLVVMKGPKGADLDFKAARQSDPAVLAELGQILFNYMSIISAGMIVFFPSYNFLNTAKSVWASSKTLDRFATKKTVFFEPEDTTAVESVLQEYAKAAQTPPSSNRKGGALLFAVIGAKLSEGLNFADDLARAVVVVGLPFANLGSAELRERMKYVKMLEEKRQATRPAGQKDAAAELYENMCMNAVNQTIGRAIRHRNDWASLLLLDRRYANAAIRNKLPKWIGGRLVVNDTFGQSIKELATFCSRRNAKA